MWPLHAFKLILWLAPGMTIEAERGCMSARREPNERSRSAGLGRVLGEEKKQDPKRSPFAQS